MNLAIGRAAFIVFALAASAIGAASQTSPRNAYYFHNLTIDKNLHPEPQDKGTFSKPESGDYYFFFHAATGLTTIDHFRRDPNTGTDVQLLYLETDAQPDQVLLRTVKRELLVSGPFGSLLAETQCFFQPNYRNRAGVRVYFHSPIYEVPEELSAWPQDAPPLTSISLVRQFRMPPELVTVTANYEADGSIGGLDVEAARNGDWTNAGPDNRALPFIGGFTRLGITPRQLSSWGIPSKFDVAQYQRERAVSLPEVSSPQEHAWVVELYGFGRLIKVADLQDGKVSRQRILRPSVTSEELYLSPIVEARFHEQQKHGIETTGAF